MHETTFFSPVEQFEVAEFEGGRLCFPVFYYDATALSVGFFTPLERVKALLPSSRMKLVRVSPWHTVTLISALQYRDTDIGPYNEVSIMFPVTLDRPAPLLSGAKLWLAHPYVYIWQLPVTSEIARYGGVRYYNLPKFIANIEITQKDGRLQCQIAEADREIFTLSVPAVADQHGNLMRWNMLSTRGDRILRCEFIEMTRSEGTSHRPADVHLELGNHPIADELRTLKLGRLFNCQYAPELQAVLTGPLESLPAHL